MNCMELFPDLEIGLLNGLLVIVLLGLKEDILLQAFPIKNVAVYVRAGK